MGMQAAVPLPESTIQHGPQNAAERQGAFANRAGSRPDNRLCAHSLTIPRESKVLAKSMFLCAALALSSTAFAANLCEGKEEVIVSFQLQKSNKTASLCQGEAFAYLVYRFGTKGKVELRYPAELNSKSWDKFEFSSYSRYGGKTNDAKSMNDITFTNEDVDYSISENWDFRKDSYYLGIMVNRGDEWRELLGKKSTQEGTLANLTDKGTPLKNKFWN
jgi:hypothetical protein